MNISEVGSALDMIRDASPARLILYSVFVLPVLLAAWSILLNGLSDPVRFRLLGLIAVIYLVGIIFEVKEQKLKRARYQLENRLRVRPGHRASFDAIKAEVAEKYTDRYLLKVIAKNPGVFRKCF
jgi:hypothetical protein